MSIEVLPDVPRDRDMNDKELQYMSLWLTSRLIKYLPEIAKDTVSADRWRVAIRVEDAAGTFFTYIQLDDEDHCISFCRQVSKIAPDSALFFIQRLPSQTLRWIDEY